MFQFKEKITKKRIREKIKHLKKVKIRIIEKIKLKKK